MLIIYQFDFIFKYSQSHNMHSMATIFGTRGRIQHKFTSDKFSGNRLRYSFCSLVLNYFKYIHRSKAQLIFYIDFNFIFRSFLCNEPFCEELVLTFFICL